MTSAYTINLNPNITTPVKTGYTFKAGDKGITFNLVVQEMDPTGTSAKIAFHRANGTSVEASLAGGGPNYSYTILGNEFAVPGVVVADVKFYQSTTQRVSTASFIFNVIGDTLDGLGGGTAGYSDELETLRATMEGYIEAFGELSPMKPRGAYSSSTQYYPGDCVTLNSASWLCIQPCKNVTPNDNAYWQKVVEVADPTKADKVNGATNGNLAALNASGNLTDSGKKLTEIYEEIEKVLENYTLLGSWVGGNSWQTQQLSDSLTNYKEIMLCITGVTAQEVIINPVRISYKKFKTLNSGSKYLRCAAMLSTSALCSYLIYYSSDSSIYLYAENGLSTQYKGALYGIK